VAYALTTDSAGVTTIPAASGKFTTSFTTDSVQTLSLRFVRVTGSGTLVISNVIVGPGTQPQGAVVGEWQSYTPTVTNNTNITTTTAIYRRNGSSLDGYVILDATGAGSGGVIAISLPTGLSNTNLPLGAIFGPMRFFDSGVTNYTGVTVKNDATSIYAQRDGVPGAVSGSDFSVGDSLKLEFTLPIAEWAGSGTVNVAQNDVEFASSTTGSWDADASVANSVYGPNGSPISGALSASRNKVVRLSSPVQVGDRVTLEYQLSASGLWIEQADSTFAAMITSGLFYGGYITAISGTDVTVSFGQYAYGTAGSNFGLTGGNWSTSPINAWRVRKTSAGSAVGFGLADASGNSGLVNPYNTASASVVVGGTYTPTISSNLNCSVTAAPCHYSRVGPIVTVSGQFVVDVVAAGGAEYLITLPIPSNFTAARDTQGTCAHAQVGGLYDAGQVLADIAGDKAQINWRSSGVDLAPREQGFIFTYIIK